MRGQRITYCAAEMDWLEANRLMVISDYHRAFRGKFGRPEISALHLHSLRKRKGWKTGREGDRYKGRHRRYSAHEMAWLAANHALPIGEYHAAFTAAFSREDVRPQNLHALRKRMGWKTGRSGCFVKGQASHNKGKACPPGTGGRHPNARATQFKKGQRSGIAVNLYKPVGTERLSKDGYREVKVHDGMPLQSRWRAVHLVEWERLNGPVPNGFALKSLDGDRANTDPSNWELVPRGLLPRLNGKSKRGYDHAPAELKPVIMAIAKLEHRVANAGRRREAAE